MSKQDVSNSKDQGIDELGPEAPTSPEDRANNELPKIDELGPEATTSPENSANNELPKIDEEDTTVQILASGDPEEPANQTVADNAIIPPVSESPNETPNEINENADTNIGENKQPIASASETENNEKEQEVNKTEPETQNEPQDESQTTNVAEKQYIDVTDQQKENTDAAVENDHQDKEKVALSEQDTKIEEYPIKTEIEQSEDKGQPKPRTANDLIELIKIEIQKIQDQIQDQEISPMELAELVQTQLQSILHPDDLESAATVVVDLINQMTDLSYEVYRKLSYSLVDKKFVYTQNPEYIEDYMMPLSMKTETQVTKTVSGSDVNATDGDQTEEVNQSDQIGTGKTTFQLDEDWGFPLAQIFYTHDQEEKEILLKGVQEKEDEPDNKLIYSTKLNKMTFHEPYLNEYVNKFQEESEIKLELQPTEDVIVESQQPSFTDVTKEPGKEQSVENIQHFVERDWGFPTYDKSSDEQQFTGQQNVELKHWGFPQHTEDQDEPVYSLEQSPPIIEFTNWGFPYSYTDRYGLSREVSIADFDESNYVVSEILSETLIDVINLHNKDVAEGIVIILLENLFEPQETDGSVSASVVTMEKSKVVEDGSPSLNIEYGNWGFPLDVLGRYGISPTTEDVRSEVSKEIELPAEKKDAITFSDVFKEAITEAIVQHDLAVVKEIPSEVLKQVYSELEKQQLQNQPLEEELQQEADEVQVPKYQIANTIDQYVQTDVHISQNDLITLDKLIDESQKVLDISSGELFGITSETIFDVPFDDVVQMAAIISDILKDVISTHNRYVAEEMMSSILYDSMQEIEKRELFGDKVHEEVQTEIHFSRDMIVTVNDFLSEVKSSTQVLETPKPEMPEDVSELVTMLSSILQDVINIHNQAIADKILADVLEDAFSDDTKPVKLTQTDVHFSRDVIVTLRDLMTSIREENEKLLNIPEEVSVSLSWPACGTDVITITDQTSEVDEGKGDGVTSMPVESNQIHPISPASSKPEKLEVQSEDSSEEKGNTNLFVIPFVLSDDETQTIKPYTPSQQEILSTLSIVPEKEKGRVDLLGSADADVVSSVTVPSPLSEFQWSADENEEIPSSFLLPVDTESTTPTEKTSMPTEGIIQEIEPVSHLPGIAEVPVMPSVQTSGPVNIILNIIPRASPDTKPGVISTINRDIHGKQEIVASKALFRRGSPMLFDIPLGTLDNFPSKSASEYAKMYLRDSVKYQAGDSVAFCKTTKYEKEKIIRNKLTDVGNELNLYEKEIQPLLDAFQEISRKLDSISKLTTCYSRATGDPQKGICKCSRDNISNKESQSQFNSKICPATSDSCKTIVGNAPCNRSKQRIESPVCNAPIRASESTHYAFNSPMVQHCHDQRFRPQRKKYCRCFASVEEPPKRSYIAEMYVTLSKLNMYNKCDACPNKIITNDIVGRYGAQSMWCEPEI